MDIFKKLSQIFKKPEPREKEEKAEPEFNAEEHTEEPQKQEQETPEI